jgi:multidrug efflux pump subunit AcrA (membrane-fusion protein)
MEDHEKIELRSDDVQEILGTPPSWILRWGSTFVFIGIILLGVVSWILKYPDIIHAPIRITTNVPPVPVVARSTGYLSKLLVKEGDTVRQGDLLVVLQNPANYEDIFKLERELHEFDSLSEVNFRTFVPSSNLVLGDLQLNYSSFVQILKEFQFKKESNFTEQSIAQYQQQIQSAQRLKRTEKDKLATSLKNLELIKQQFTRKQTLYAQNVIPKTELEEARKDVLNGEQAIKLYSTRKISWMCSKIRKLLIAPNTTAWSSPSINCELPLLSGNKRIC